MTSKVQSEGPHEIAQPCSECDNDGHAIDSYDEPVQHIAGVGLVAFFSTSAATESSRARIVIIDSGASSHMTPVSDMLVTRIQKRGSVSLGGH